MLRPLCVIFSSLTFITGIVYPSAVTTVGKIFFPTKANGSLIIKNGEVVGSELIGQSFHSEKYFWSRPSATSPLPYNASASSGSNLGPSNLTLQKNIQKLISELTDKPEVKIPVDLVTSSASGLDPDITPAAAFFQVKRVAQNRNIPIERIESLINTSIEERTFGIFGEPRVNVLKLNLGLDELR